MSEKMTEAQMLEHGYVPLTNKTTKTMNKETLQALARFQSELVAPKDKKNNFGGYNYRSAEDILAAIKPLELTHGVAIYEDSEVVQVGNYNYHKVTAHFVCEHGEVTASAFAREPETKKGMDDAQVSGATLSYAKKYALGNLLNIDDSRLDPDKTQGRQDTLDFLSNNNKALDYYTTKYGVKFIDEFTEKQLGEIYKELKKNKYI